MGTFVAGAVLACGCAVPLTGKDGTRHHVIIGLGWVRTGSQPGVAAEDLRTIGLVANASGGALGLSRIHRVELNPHLASNSVVAIRSGAGGLSLTNFAVSQTQLPKQTP
jgi:hypothetical protein